MIETETTAPTKGPGHWMKPMGVMWGSVLIVLALIVLGTWMNKRRAMEDTREVRARFAVILDDFVFSTEEEATLESEFEDTLTSAGAGEPRRATASRLMDRMQGSIACFALEVALRGIDIAMKEHAGPPPQAQARWPGARDQAVRVIHAVDHGGVDPGVALVMFSPFIKDRQSWTPDEVDRFAADCASLADKAEAPAEPEAFKLYESLHRGIVEARDAK